MHSVQRLLRGLNPPHRVKSISMATFSADEVEFLRSRGNFFCRKVWLAACDSQPELKDSDKKRDFFIQKYEKKRWHVEPSEELYAETIQRNSPQASGSPGQTGAAVMPPPASESVRRPGSRGPATESAISRPSPSPVAHQHPAPQPNPAQSSGSLLDDLSDAFSAPQSTSFFQPSTSLHSSLTNTASHSAFSSSTASASLPADLFSSAGPYPNVSPPPYPGVATANVPVSSGFADFASFGAPLTVSATPTSTPIAPLQPSSGTSSVTQASQPEPGDPYKALSELDDLFTLTGQAAPSVFSSGATPHPTAVPWGLDSAPSAQPSSNSWQPTPPSNSWQPTPGPTSIPWGQDHASVTQPASVPPSQQYSTSVPPSQNQWAQQPSVPWGQEHSVGQPVSTAMPWSTTAAPAANQWSQSTAPAPALSWGTTSASHTTDSSWGSAPAVSTASSWGTTPGQQNGGSWGAPADGQSAGSADFWAPQTVQQTASGSWDSGPTTQTANPFGAQSVPKSQTMTFGQVPSANPFSSFAEFSSALPQQNGQAAFGAAPLSTRSGMATSNPFL